MIMDPWRNGSALDSSPKGCVFKSRWVHIFFSFLFFSFFLPPLVGWLVAATSNPSGFAVLFLPPLAMAGWLPRPQIPLGSQCFFCPPWLVGCLGLKSLWVHSVFLPRLKPE